jgi:hypothetical protein
MGMKLRRLFAALALVLSTLSVACSADGEQEAPETSGESAIGVSKALVSFLKEAKQATGEDRTLRAFGKHLYVSLSGKDQAGQARALRSLFGADLPKDMTPNAFRGLVFGGAEQSTYLLRMSPADITADGAELRALQEAWMPSTERAFETLLESSEEILGDLKAAGLPESQIYDMFTAAAWMRAERGQGRINERLLAAAPKGEFEPSDTAMRRVRDATFDALQGGAPIAPGIEMSGESAGGALVAAAVMAERVAVRIEGGKVTGALLRRTPIGAPSWAPPTEATNLQSALTLALRAKRAFADSLAAMGEYGHGALTKISFFRRQQLRVERTCAILEGMRKDAALAEKLSDPAAFERHLAEHWDELWAEESMRAR